MLPSFGGFPDPEPETPIDPYANVVCQHSGTCSNGVCDCTGTGYTGDHCETACSAWLDANTNCCTDMNSSETCCVSYGTRYQWTSGTFKSSHSGAGPK